MAPLDCFDVIWFCDFEYRQPDGETPTPICMVAVEYRSGRLIRLWTDELRARSKPPFPIGPNSLFVAYYASAELLCFLALDWPFPVRVLDLCVEFKRLTSGLMVPCGRGILVPCSTTVSTASTPLKSL